MKKSKSKVRSFILLIEANFYAVFLSIFVDFRGGTGASLLKGMKGVGEEPNHMIARKRKPGPLNLPKLLSKNLPNTEHASFCGFFFIHIARG